MEQDVGWVEERNPTSMKERRVGNAHQP